MSIFKYTLLISIILLSGCATFRDGANPAISKWPIDKATKNKTLALQVTGKALVNNQIKDVNVQFLEKWREQVLRAYEDSNLFSKVNVGSEPADIRAEVVLTDKGEGSTGLAFLTGLTMLIIPSHVHEGFTIKTTFKDKEGKVLGISENAEFSDTWIQLFMFPLMPFYFPSSEVKDMLYDLNRNTIIDAHSKWVF